MKYECNICGKEYAGRRKQQHVENSHKTLAYEDFEGLIIQAIFVKSAIRALKEIWELIREKNMLHLLLSRLHSMEYGKFNLLQLTN